MPVEQHSIPSWAREEDVINESHANLDWVQDPIQTENFKLQTDQQSQRLQQQMKIIQALKSNSDLLIEHYRKTQSMLGWLADSYGKKSWTSTCIEAITITSIASCLTTIGQVGFIIGALSCSLYFISSMLLSNHYWITTKKEQLLRDNVQVMEQDLQKSVAQLQLIETKLNFVVESLNDQNLILTQQSTSFAQNIANLTEQVRVFEIETKKLTTQHLSIMEQVPEIISNLQQALHSIQETNERLATQSNQLNTINMQISDTNYKINTTSEQFTSVTGIFTNETEKLASLINSVQHLHDIMAKNTTNCNMTSAVLSAQKELNSHMQEKDLRQQRHAELLSRASKSLKNSQNIMVNQTPPITSDIRGAH